MFNNLLNRFHNHFQILSLVVGLMSAQIAWGQGVISGQVFDGSTKSNLPLANVVLQLTLPPNKIVQAVVADDNGRFTLSVSKPGLYEIKIMQVGYTTLSQKVEISSLTTTDLGAFNLSSISQGLGEVVITGRKPMLEQKPDRISMHVEGSLLAAGNNAYEVLAAAPGIQLVEGQPLRLRGKTGVVIYFNNKRLPSGTSLETLLASIPGDQIDRIELIHNPSSKYDADAAGGIIEIYTKRALKPGWTANISSNFRQGHRTGAGINGGVQANLGKIDFAASSSYNKRGGFEFNNGNRQFYNVRTPIASQSQNSDLDKVSTTNSFSSSLNYHINKYNTIGVSADIQGSSLEGNGIFNTILMQPVGITTSVVQEDVLLRGNFGNYNIFYKRELDSLHSNFLITSAYASLNNIQQQTFRQRISGPSDSTGLPSNFRNYIPAIYHISTTTADYIKHYSANAYVEAGIKYTDTRNRSRQQAESLNNGVWEPQALALYPQLGYKEQVAASYINGNYNFGKVNLVAGLRAEHTNYRVEYGIDSTYFNLFPNIRADYKINDNYTFSLGYARNINRPSYESLIPYERFQDTYTSSRGNARLRPEYAHSFSWNNNYKDYSFQLNYTLTSDAISQIYVYNPATLRLTDTQRNLPRRHIATATFIAPLSIGTIWTTNLSAVLIYHQLSLPDPLDISTSLIRRKGYVELSSDNSFKLGNGWTARLYGSYNSPSIDGLFDYDSYSSVLIGLKKSLFKKRATLNLSITDLFYQTNFRVSTSVPPVFFDVHQRNDTRQFRISFTFNFGQSNFKSKRIESNTNTTERGRLGF